MIQSSFTEYAATKETYVNDFYKRRVSPWIVGLLAVSITLDLCMARPIRIKYPGSMYHVMCRGNNGRDETKEGRKWLSKLS